MFFWQTVTSRVYEWEITLTAPIHPWLHQWPLNFTMDSKQWLPCAWWFNLHSPSAQGTAVSWIWERKGSAQLPSEVPGCLSRYILWDSCMLMCTRSWGQQQSLELPGRNRTRNPFSVGSQRHELGRLDIQERNESLLPKDITYEQQQPNTLNLNGFLPHF